MALHDSKLLAWELQGADLRARLDAYLHVSTGVPGQDQGTGWSQEIELVLRNAVVLEAPPETPLWIGEGAVEIAGAALHLVPVPLDSAGPVRISLEGVGGQLIATGDGLSLSARGEARFVERFAGAAD